MTDHDQRAKAFLAWLEARILQREYTYARMQYSRNRELLRSEIGEAKQIRDRLVAFLQGTPIPERPDAAAAADTSSAPGAGIDDDSALDASFERDAKPRVMH